MSLPQQIANKIKEIPMDPIALANNPELAYMLSFSKHQISHQSVQCSPRDTYHSPLSDYNFVDFEQKIYEQLLEETQKNYEGKNSTVIKSIRNSFKEFFTRVSSVTYEAAVKKSQKIDEMTTPVFKLPNSEEQYKINEIRGNNPLQWPKNLEQFYNQINKLPWNAFSAQPQNNFDLFLKNIRKSIKLMLNNLEKVQNRKQHIIHISRALQVMLSIALKTTNQTYILEQYGCLSQIDFEKYLKQDQEKQIISKLQAVAQNVLDKIPVIEEQQYHMPKKLWDRGQAFMIMKKIHFQKQNGLGFFSVTTDGTYLYVYISAINGGMYKIGTGKNSSIAGKIYLEKQILLPVGSRLDQINWVYLKGKLYLKSSCRDPFILEVINPQNLLVETSVELRCEGLFGHQALINLNRNSILLTDGEYLYFLGKQLKITQSKQQNSKQRKPEPETPKQSVNNDNKLRKKKKKKGQNQQIPVESKEQAQKVVQFLLCKYDINFEPKQPECNQSFAHQLYQSFNYFFTLQQCKRSLDVCDNDLSEAAQWLVAEGEKQRNISILYPLQKVIIAQSELTNNFNEKNIKSSNDLVTKDNSLLHLQNINQSLWTMDREQITCYSQVGIKIFSKDNNDSHFMQGTQLQTTYMKTCEGKFPRNPTYSITYDPYNEIFYVYTWPVQGGHYFPTAVLIGSDYKSCLEINLQKRTSISNESPKRINEFSKWLLLTMNFLDNTHCPNCSRVNDWMWFFAQKIIDLNSQINAISDANDKKKLSNKRSKILLKMNRLNQTFNYYQKQKKQLDQNKKITKQIYLIPPYAPEGTLISLKLIRQAFGDKIEKQNILEFLIPLQNWLQYSPNIVSHEISQYLIGIRQQLEQVQKSCSPEINQKIIKIFIQNFYLFYPRSEDQQNLILRLSESDIKYLIEKIKLMSRRHRRSITYEIKSKDLLFQKLDSKTKFAQKYMKNSTFYVNRNSQADSVGNLLVQKIIRGNSFQSSKKEENKQLSTNKICSFLEKYVISSQIGLKFLQTLFLEAFKLLVRQQNPKQFIKPLEKLFQKAFKIIQVALFKSSIIQIKNLSQTLLMFLQLYFCSLCSLNPQRKTIEILLKVVQGLNRKQLKEIVDKVSDSDFEGISQTSQKVYQTPHPIERGKNQNFPPFKNPESLLIFAQFDKRCQSDVNHDIMHIQLIHEGSPVGNSIQCNDGVFSTALKMTGKVETKKPYLILGNSVTVDFSSSGHAKDAKSFGRYGFRFGLRPVFSSKTKLNSQKQKQVQKIFNNMQNFERYIYTLKLAVVVTSDSIQRLNYLEKTKNQNQTVNKILKGKIFKEGYQEEYIQKTKEQTDNVFYLKQEQVLDSRLAIIKNLHQYQYKQDTQKKNLQNHDSIQSLWNFQGIPSYIKVYLDKIKQFKGDFIELFKQARKLAPPKLNFANQLRRQSFTDQFKQLWLQGEAILFLTVLKHSGLLHLNLKFSIEYIKQNLKAFEQARTGIFQSFINKMQIVRQWNNLVEQFHKNVAQKEKIEEKKEVEKTKPAVTVKKRGMTARTVTFGKNNVKPQQKKQQNREEIEQQKKKRKKQGEKAIRQRLTQNFIIKSICSLKKIDYAPDNTYENVTKIIELIQKQEYKNQVQSVYIEPMKRLICSCLFLLKIKSPSTQENLHQGQSLVPDAVTRSLSSDNRHVNVNKVNLFREWLQNWKKWKDFKKQGKVQLKFPVSQIVEFVNSWISIDQFTKQINIRRQKGEQRISFYEYINNLLKLTSNSFLTKYVIGSQVASILGGHKCQLQAVGSQKIKQIQNLYNNYQSALKNQENSRTQMLPLRYSEFKKLINKSNHQLLEKIRLCLIHLYVISSQNKYLNLELGMFVIPFKYLTSNYQQLSFIASLIVQRVFLANNSLEQILQTLQKQIGWNSLSARRWKDYYFMEKILFLLKKIEMKAKQALEVGQKRKLCGKLFYILYHIEAPIIQKICLRIIKKLKIDLKNRIQTPYDVNYKVIQISQGLIKCQQFKIQNQKSLTNPEILATKCSSLFSSQSYNPIKDKLLGKNKALPDSDQQDTYNIILNLQNQQQITWLVQVLYYLQEIQQNIVPIKNWQQYLQKKNKKKEPKDNQNKQQPNESQLNANNKKRKIAQRIFDTFPHNLPNLAKQLEKQLPVGWFINYCDVYNQFTNQIQHKALKSSALPAPLPAINQKKNKNNQQLNQNNGKKAWNPVQFIKLYKKYQDLTSKPLEEPKQQQSNEAKQQFVRAKNFISRMRKHCAEASSIMHNFSQTGHYIFRQNVSLNAFNKICKLFSLGAQNSLKQIPCEFTLKDYSTRLSPSFPILKKKSDLKILCVKSSKYKKFSELINAPAVLLTRIQNQSQFSYTNLNLTEYVLQDKSISPFSDYLHLDFPDDQEAEFGKQFIESNIAKMRMKHDQVIIKDYPSLRYFLSQGGLESGMDQCTVIPAFDEHLAPQTASFDKLQQNNTMNQSQDDPEQLLQKCIQLMKRDYGKITQKHHIKPFMLLTFYLKKICDTEINLLPQQILKNFGQELYKFAKNFKAQQSIEEYEEQIQILIMRILDSQNQNLSFFKLYRFNQDEIDDDLKKFITQTQNSQKNEDKKNLQKQSLETHQNKKSNYLLPIQPPIPEENNLLKYWQKNILPKIYDFVKTTLRPIQIQDFFEQMRIPLRAGDQTQAKKIAYVICDNKLPQGAVLPDANHNWNSLTIQQISVGMDVLVKLPRTQSSTPLLASNSQNYRLAQVIFIDSKNLSVLIKQRIFQMGIFSYTWVPVNTLQCVQKSLAHYSKSSIYEQMQKCLKGMIYNFSKICMTSLSDKVELNKAQLMNETIIDTFRNNPISGWQQQRTWPLKPVLKKMIKQGNLNFIQELEKNFCPFESYDINLYSQQMISLNRFNKALGLIITFKKNASLIWYSGVKFFADQYGYKQINDVYASKVGINQLEPLEFHIPNVYCRYYSNKTCLKAAQQGKYDQKQIPATVTAIDPIWTSSVFLGSVTSQIVLEEKSYQNILTRINKVYIKWLTKRPPFILSSHICPLISKISRTIIKIKRDKKQNIKLEDFGVSEVQLENLIQWISQIYQEQSKEIIVLYCPLVQNLIQAIATILSGIQKIPNLKQPIPEYLKQTVKLIQMICEIEQNFKGKSVKVPDMRNVAQFERILVVQNIPQYVDQKELRKCFKQILQKNNGKILAPSFDIFYHNNSAVVLVDSWDINELIQQQIMEKIQQQQQKQPEPEQGGGLLMEWQCEICTFFNQAGIDSCEMCGSAAPAPKQQIVYEKVESTDVNKAEKKLREKQMKRFESIKTEIVSLIEQMWKKELNKLDKEKQIQEKKNEQKRRKRTKKQPQVTIEQKPRPEQPKIKLSSGSTVLESAVIQIFLQQRFKALPKSITDKVQGITYLQKFKHLMKLGYDFWGDNIANQSPSLMNLDYLSQLMQYIQDEICKGSSSVLSYSQDSIRIMKSIPLLMKQNGQQPINFKAQNNMQVQMKYKKLENQKSYNIRYSWRIIKELNISASKCLSLINMNINSYESQTIDQTNPLGVNMKFIRRLIMGTIKLQLFQKIMQKTSVSLQSHQIPKITLERMKIKDQKTKLKGGLVSVKQKDQFMFTKAQQQLDKVSSINLRSFKPKGTQPYLSFGVNFKGEDVMGQAGPYRQFFTDISSELNPNVAGIGLFIKTPNNLHKIGESRQKWVINPKANTTYHLSLFQFLGILMGSCIRTGCHMTIDLCEFCWKLIAGQSVKDSDIDEFDRQFYEQIRQLIDCPSEQIFDSLEEIVDQPVTWVYQTIDGQQRQLINNGKVERVTYEDRLKYVDLMKKKRIGQIDLQITHIRQGLSQMIPKEFLHQFSGEELKVMICGVPKVDVQLLKKHTKYAGNLKEDSPTIIYFWQMMKELSEEQKLKLIKFCWGQERLPLNSQEFQRNGIRFMIKPMMNCRKPDQSLPKADTCFFNIELPQYSSRQIMKQKVLLAVNLDSTSINGDRVMRADDNPLMGNVDYDDEDDEGDENGGW